MSTLEAVEADRNLRRRRFAMATLAVLALAGIGLAVVAVRDVQEERSARGAAVQRLQGQLAQAEQRALALQARTAALQSENRGFLKRIGALQRSLDASRTDLAPLASRILRSVFVVVTPTGFGTGWAAWRADGETYLITANHVAQDAVARGTHQVTIDQKGRSWPGVIVATDSVNDLAVIRVANLDAPPLWQAPDTRRGRRRPDPARREPLRSRRNRHQRRRQQGRQGPDRDRRRCKPRELGRTSGRHQRPGRRCSPFRRRNGPELPGADPAGLRHRPRVPLTRPATRTRGPWRERRRVW
jgi:hypothetical protein